MKRVILILILLGLVSLACIPGTIPDAGTTNNPGNLNTPSSSNPGQDINTALPPTVYAPAQGTPLGDSPGPGTPTIPTINEQETPPIFTPTLPPGSAPTAAP